MARTSIRRNLLATTIIAGSLAAAPALAQGAPADAATDDSTIVVTGSLITNPNLTRSSPVNVTTSEEIELKQVTVAEQILREIPGITPNIGSAVNNGANGANEVDLRGLGSNRNIALLDGRRLVPSGLEGVFDLNNVPVALLDRVDVLTGGATTTYGADAITGVVNFITKSDFAGVEVQVSQAITEQGDGNIFRADLTIGANFDDGRGNAVLSVGYQEADPVFQGDREISNSNYDSFSGALGGSGTGVPSIFTRFDPALPTARRQINTTTGLPGPVTLFNFNPFNIFQTPFERFNIYGAARYEINDAVEVYSRAMFSKNTISTVIAPSGIFSSDVVIPLSNPYLTTPTRNSFCAANGITPAECAAAATAAPGSADYRTITSNVRRRTTELGPRTAEYVTQIFDVRVGVRGAITDTLNYDIGASYGESDRPQTLGGYLSITRLRQAVLAQNTTTCNNTSSGCVPVNLFGPQGSITPAQAAFLAVPSTTTIRSQLAQASASVSGELANISGGDAVSFAVGTEFRRYGSQQFSDLLAQTPGELGGAGGAAPNITGGYNVYEALGELVVPLIQDKPFFKSLTLEGGARYSKYSVDAAGSPSYDAFTWKAGGSWEPFDSLKIRGNYSRAVRAPNIEELFSPNSVGLTNLSFDPCAGAAPTTNANLRAVCLAQGAPVATIGFIAQPSAGQANATTQGSTALQPEKADTWTIGAVFQPFSGFSVSIDYYNVIVNDAITAARPGDAIQACFNNISAASATNPACTQIRRSPSTGALDGDPANTGGLFLPTTNSGRLFTNGIDLSVNFRQDIGFAKLGLAFNGNYTFQNRFRSVPLGTDRDCVGFYSVNCSFTGSLIPKFQWTQRTTLGFSGVDVSLLWRHIDSFVQEPDDINGVFGNGPAFSGTLAGGDLGSRSVNFGKIKAFDYFDLSTRISITDNVVVTLTGTNIFNRKPPVVGSTIGSTSYNSGNTYPSTYDSLGRRISASVKLKF